MRPWPGCFGCFGMIVAVIVVLAAVAVSAASTKPLAVDDIIAAGFKRVPGPGMGGSVLDIGPEKSWYGLSASMPTVLYDGKLYRMWFVGSAATEDPSYPYKEVDVLGLATSPDGLNWTVANDGKPVMEPGPKGSFDAKGISHPYVLYFADKYWLWYAAIDGSTAGDLGLAPAHVRVECICLATSKDGIHWTRENGGNPVLDIGPPGSIDSIQVDGPSVLRIKDKFVMWYGGYGGKHSLGVAESKDGIHWTRLNGGKALTGLTGKEQLGPTVYFDGKRYLLLYEDNRGENNAGPSWNIYAATSDDGINWKSEYGGKPVLSPPPPGSFDTAGVGGNYAVHPSQIVIAGNKARVWYMGEELNVHQRTGLMEAVVGK